MNNVTEAFGDDVIQSLVQYKHCSLIRLVFDKSFELATEW